MNYQTLKTYTQGLLSIFKKDWKENNPSSIEYIKNRPFFIEDELEEKIIFSLPLTMHELPNEDNNHYYQYEWLQISSQNIDIENNDIFFIKIDNDIKELNVFIEDGTYIMLIGNSEEDCEFFMKIIPYGERFNIGDIKSKIKINHIVLFQKVEKIHYLDSKYLNNDIARTSDLNNKLALSAINPHGTGSFAVGYNVHANGDYSHAEGMSAEASGNYSHAEGYKTKADGYSSHAEGYWTCANGDYSHAEGQHTEANGDYSHAEGQHTEANGDYSHAEGHYTEANSDYSHVQGKYNIVDTSNKYAHIVGNGTSSSKRSNAHTLDWDGNAWFAGDVYVGSFSGVNKDSGSKKLIAAPSDVVAGDLLTYDGTNWVRISKADLIAEIIAALPRAEEATF